MNKGILSLSILTLAIMAASTVNADTFSEALQNGSTSINTRTFYFNRSFDKPNTPDTEALTVGGIMKYESGKIGNNTKLGFAYYGSHRLLDLIDRDKGGGTSILQSSTDDIAFLGEAYIDFSNGANQLKIGRQKLNGPLMNNHDLRMLPSTYEAIVFRNKGLANTTLEAGYVKRYSGFTSKLSGFDSQSGKWGTDGLGYVLGKTKLGIASVRGQYINTLDDTGTFESYSYLDAKVPLAVGQKSYIKGQYAGTGYQVGDDSTMFGVKAGTTVGSVDLALLYNKVEDNAFKAVEAGPMYSDWQQGYGKYEPSSAVGVQVVFHPVSKASIKLGYVDVESEEGDAFNDDTFQEFNLDAKYKLSSASKLRVRYSNKSQDENSNREDRDDFRIIYYHNF